jgi:dynein heavy chain
MKMLLEIRDLKFATPATVSRGGVIYIYDTDGWQWRSYVEAWIANSKIHEQMKKGNIPQDKQNDAINQLKSFLLVKYMPKMLETFKKSFKRPFPIADIALVTTTCQIFDAIFEGHDVDRLN